MAAAFTVEHAPEATQHASFDLSEDVRAKLHSIFPIWHCPRR